MSGKQDWRHAWKAKRSGPLGGRTLGRLPDEDFYSSST